MINEKTAFGSGSATGARRAGSATGGWLGRFWKDSTGTMSYMAVAGSLVMMVFGGIGIDMIHAELKRTKVQNTLDRATLAAADLQQMLDPDFVVNDYFRAMDMSEALVSVDVETGLNYRRVVAEGYTTISSNFMQLIGVQNLQAEGVSAAEERINKVEVSLVLDISGSMENNDKMERLKSASQLFLDTIMTNQNHDLVSVSLVPYSEQVNVGPAVANHLNVDWRHGFSHCLEVPGSEFGSATLNTSITYEQTQHFQWNYFGNNDRDDTVCPQFSYEQITPFSMDREALKGQISQLQPRAGTSIFLGMKWATALLDPSSRAIADTQVSSGAAPMAVSGRPVDYDDEETIKTVVLMTDGQHDRSFRIQDWAYNSDSEIALWNRNNLWYYLVNNVSSRHWGAFYTQKYNAGMGDQLLDSICDAAKAQGIVVWGIGFEVTDHGAAVMQNCASSPSHFFRVEGAAIEDAFYAIARTINQLRLTQ